MPKPLLPRYFVKDRWFWEMSGSYKFTEGEIRQKLEELGYQNIPKDKLVQFAEDLEELIEYENTKSSVSLGYSSTCSDSYPTDSYVDSEEPSLSTSQEVTDSTRRESLQAFTHHRSPRVPKGKSDSVKVSHEHYGKENVIHPMHDTVKPRVYTAPDAVVHGAERPASRQGIKRKVLRRKAGESRVFDESFTSSESVTDISDLEQRLRDLPLSGKDEGDVISIGSEDSQEPRGYRPWEMYAGRAPPSYIRPSTSHPHTRRLKKCDPVSRYHQFKSEWNHKKAPGENSHKNLRWNMRGKLLQCDIFEKPQRVFVPNKYVVPTEKKRQALRWQVRTDLASQ